MHEHDPSDRKGLYGNGQGLKEILRDGPHDFVTIQQRSSISHDAATYRPYASKIQAYVKQHAPEAELLLHETWAYRVDDRRFTSPGRDPGEPRTQREMYEQLAKAYRTIATELGVRLRFRRPKLEKSNCRGVLVENERLACSYANRAKPSRIAKLSRFYMNFRLP